MKIISSIFLITIVSIYLYSNGKLIFRLQIFVSLQRHQDVVNVSRNWNRPDLL